jgi:heterodisulfide reductase subunit C
MYVPKKEVYFLEPFHGIVELCFAGIKKSLGPVGIISYSKMKQENDRVEIMLKTCAQSLKPTPVLAERLAELTKVTACYQCKKCSSGCPMTFAMDFYPDRVIRLALLGQEAQVLGCRTIWVCSACETCTTRCPNNIDIAGVMDWLKEEALRQGYTSPQPGVTRFHQTFLDTVRLAGGRLSEPLLLGLYQWRSGGTMAKFKSGALVEDLKMAWELARRRRLVPRLPHRLQGAKEIKGLFKKTQI